MPKNAPWLAPWVFDLSRFDEAADKAAADKAAADQAAAAKATADKAAADKAAADQAAADKAKTPEQVLADAKAETEKWKALSRTNEDRAKANADKAKRFDEAEAANQTEAEKLTKRAEEAEQRAAARTKVAVRSEVRALADDFIDRSDAVDQLALQQGGLERFVNDAGDIDTEAIKTALAEVLGKKQHLKKGTGQQQDPSLGSRGGGKPADYRTADRKEFVGELAAHGLRPRST